MLFRCVSLRFGFDNHAQALRGHVQEEIRDVDLRYTSPPSDRRRRALDQLVFRGARLRDGEDPRRRSLQTENVRARRMDLRLILRTVCASAQHQKLALSKPGANGNSRPNKGSFGGWD